MMADLNPTQREKLSSDLFEQLRAKGHAVQVKSEWEPNLELVVDEQISIVIEEDRYISVTMDEWSESNTGFSGRGFIDKMVEATIGFVEEAVEFSADDDTDDGTLEEVAAEDASDEAPAEETPKVEEQPMAKAKSKPKKKVDPTPGPLPTTAARIVYKKDPPPKRQRYGNVLFGEQRFSSTYAKPVPAPAPAPAPVSDAAPHPHPTEPSSGEKASIELMNELLASKGHKSLSQQQYDSMLEHDEIPDKDLVLKSISGL
jgi:hypothetical protein